MRGSQTTSHAARLARTATLFTDRRLLVFAVCVMLFHLSNAAMLPLVGAEVTMRAATSPT